MTQTDIPAGRHPQLWALVTPLRDVMGERGVVQKRLARLAGVDRSTVSRWLSGRMLPPLEPLLQIAADLRVDVTMVRHRWELAAATVRDPQVRRDALLAEGAPPSRMISHADLMRALRGLLRARGYPSGTWSAGIPRCDARRSGPCCAESAAPAWTW
jgi:transcriptional regulator with XRE-family HTH domain